MYGEGYDYVPLYTPSSGDMVGGLPVGIESKDEDDAPYWPVQAMWTYKEIWGHPVTNWIWLLKDIEGPAIVDGQANGPVTFKEITTGQLITVIPNGSTGHFKTSMPEGKYIISSDGTEQSQTFLPAASYHLECRADKFLKYDVSQNITSNGEITIKLKVQGNGNHSFNIRTDNLNIASVSKQITIKTGTAQSFEWKGRITDKETPWVAVVIPDGDMSKRKEIRGAVWEK
jgi:hypothetical protein